MDLALVLLMNKTVNLIKLLAHQKCYENAVFKDCIETLFK